MEVVWIALIAFVIFVGAALVVGGAITFFLRSRSREPLRINLGFLLRLYLYVVIIVGLLVFAQGVSSLLRAGMAGVWGKEFSYNPVYVSLRGDPVLYEPHPLELKERSLLTDAEREELSLIIADSEQERLALEQERRRLGLDRALDEGLIEGVSFTLIGALIWLAHLVGRRFLDGQEEEIPLGRIYLIMATVIFGVITIVNLPQAVFESFRYVLLDPLDQFGRDYQPGGKLALSITALPIWLVYLWATIRVVRGNNSNVEIPG